MWLRGICVVDRWSVGSVRHELESPAAEESVGGPSNRQCESFANTLTDPQLSNLRGRSSSWAVPECRQSQVCGLWSLHVQAYELAESIVVRQY